MLIRILIALCAGTLFGFFIAAIISISVDDEDWWDKSLEEWETEDQDGEQK